MSQDKGYIVRRLLVDGHAGGADIWSYKKVAMPHLGETIYHGDFVRRQIETADNGPMGSTYETVYVPVDESKLTSEKYSGSEVEQF